MADAQPPSPPLDQGMDPENVAFLWGTEPIPMAIPPANFLVIGGPKSGKTLTLRLLMQSALASLGRGLGHRALVYDTDGSWEPALRGMDGRCPVHVLNLTDGNGTAWDIAADIATPAAAIQLAGFLVPTNLAGPSFFIEAARHLLAAALLGLIKGSPGKWGLYDLLLAVADPQRLRALLAGSSEAAAVQTSLDNPHLRANLLATVAASLHPVEGLADAWREPGPKLSLGRWLETESILVVRDVHQAHKPAGPIFPAMVAHLADLLLSQESSLTSRTWLCLDDFCQTGCLESLPRVMLQGRARGACIALSTSEIEGVRRLYGPDAAEQMLAACGHKTALRTSNAETAAWAERHFGPPLRAADLMSLPPAGPEHGFSAFHQSPEAGTRLIHHSWDSVLAQLRPRRDGAQG